MVPDTDLQLKVVIKALETTIAPALDPLDPLAAEQCQLAVATLSFIRSHLPLRRRLVRAELADNLALAGQLCASTRAGTLEPAIATASTALDDPDLDTTELVTVNADLLDALATVIDTSGCDREVARAVVAGWKDHARRGRAWTVSAGFELDPDSVTPIEQLLDRS
ncbi:MAG: hypothetical protein ACI915_004297 [Gammaproteobacteria bacterium]|jgi:hypothetical protein